MATASLSLGSTARISVQSGSSKSARQPAALSSKRQVVLSTKRAAVFSYNRASLACSCGDIGSNLSIEGGDFGARDARPDEIESNFNSKSLGHADTDHLLTIPEAGRHLLSLDSRSCDRKLYSTLVDEQQQEIYRKQVLDWKIVSEDGVNRLRRDFTAKNFNAGLDMFGRIGEMAEEQGHHPDLHIEGWNKVRVEMWSHEAGGITENDFILAAKLDKIDMADLIKAPKKKQRFWA
mmetsp:Transcript_42465/g.51505  ORF Transcript_42465/g.51505 Transcript_42465/m.51505 type:complete len:235 (+) Transcript_42465:115-819(+)|eukprot:CAMPEP_0197845474 /NCGR_PEP_ID=MMETSP1438-20131217/2399_1 /TAXON_ID=1461541 /ORGANISM="Pterosperma sp., Strain CCMP1384" /LENGTH=234 /DNA_ID=CAMNT_0043456781 /DNA_START=113 /DNA_END=817 /DNA_ORIENTATION=+